MTSIARPRVLHGVIGQAGQPRAYAQGLRQLGIDAASCAIRAHKFGYPDDLSVQLTNRNSLEQTMADIAPLVARFDIFHFHARSFLSRWPDHEYPSLCDLLALKMLGKKVFFHFRGQEARLASEFAARNPYNYVTTPEGAALFASMPDVSKRKSFDFIRAVCDGIFSVDPEVQGYVPGSTIVPRVLVSEEWPFVGVSDGRKRPVIVHAPSRRGVKGTEAVLEAARRLEFEGIDFELRLVENMSHADANSIYRDADIVIDQLRIGWYGVLATEAMALGKPVIAHIRDDLWETHCGSLPLFNATLDNLHEIMRLLITNPTLRTDSAAKSRAYFLKTHAADAVCRSLLEIYNDAVEVERPLDVAAVCRYFDYQVIKTAEIATRRAERAAMKLAQAGNAPARKRLFDPPLAKIPARVSRRILKRIFP